MMVHKLWYAVLAYLLFYFLCGPFPWWLAGLLLTCCGLALLSMLSSLPSLPYTELTPQLTTCLLKIGSS